MMVETYTFVVMETVTRERIYTVKAASEEKAREMAERGDTLAEETAKEHGVLDREIVD